MSHSAQAQLNQQTATALQQGHSHILEDLRSRNGTFVNGQRVTRCALQHGDKIMVGDTTLLFRLH